MAWDMKGNALAGTDLIKIWSLSERKGREKNDSLDSNIISKVEERMRTWNRLGRECVRCVILDLLAERVHRPSGSMQDDSFGPEVSWRERLLHDQE